jgi:hypothetical protein
LNLVSDLPYEHDVQMRSPDVTKAREMLGFEAATTLEGTLQVVDEEAFNVRVDEAGAREGVEGAVDDLAAPGGREGFEISEKSRSRIRLFAARRLAARGAGAIEAATRWGSSPNIPLGDRQAREELEKPRPNLAVARQGFAEGRNHPDDIDSMFALAKSGADVVAGSRYMRGGRQLGGPLLKRSMSRAAGLSLHWLSGIPIHDATSNFRMYSKRLLDQVTIESDGGFELGIELTVKAHLLGMRVAEVPTTWRDRTAGESRFQLWRWLPRYLRWYGRGIAGRFGANR